jgi:hypothetical protein
MRAEQAERIVNEYGRVMAESFSASTAAPASMLPYPKATIKEAIRSYAGALHILGELKGQIRDQLAAGYGYLAAFVDDEEAQTVREGELALLRADGDKLLKDDYDSWVRKLERHTEAYRRISECMRGLHIEYREFEVSIGVRQEVGDYEADVRAAEACLRRELRLDSELAPPDASSSPKPWWAFWRR